MAQRTLTWLYGLLGPVLFFAVLLLPAPAGMAPEAWYVCGLAAWMMVWWISEILPLAVTALLPIIIMPLTGVTSLTEATAPYANPVIFLFLGGFLLALAIQSSGLHRRLALAIVSFGGDRLDRLVAAVMLATAFLSMWISNTAAAALLLPVALSVLALAQPEGTSDESAPLAPALLIGVAFAANIGGMATLIGTPPNAILAAYLGSQYDIQLSFAGWMLVALPLSLLLLWLAWWVLVRWSFPLGQGAVAGLSDIFAERASELGAWTTAEKRVALVFVSAAAAWMLRPVAAQWWPALDDAMIALVAGGVLFLIPKEPGGEAILQWPKTQDLPWGVLLLIGGGLSLGIGVQQTGLADNVAGLLSAMIDQPLALLLVLAGGAAMLVSHVTSNTAAAATLIPVAAAVAVSAGLSPIWLAMPVALAASCAFILPTATPPNAIVFGSNRLHICQMMRAGAVLTVLALALLALVAAVAVVMV